MSVSLKRRRVSPDNYVAVNDNSNREQNVTSTPTPKRASYLSPTKASLSRSNPQLLQSSASAKKSRESEPSRRQSLLDAVLGNKSLVPIKDQQDVRDAESNTNSEVGQAASTSSSQQEVANVIASIETENEVPNTPLRYDPNQYPSSSRYRNASTPRRNTQTMRFVSPKIVPQLVDSSRNRRKSGSAEVELPPTPVQLGNGKLPDRPRGLSSSSPGGSDGRRARIRGGNIYSSPLKPRELAPVLSEEEGDLESDVEIASGLGDNDQDDTTTTNSAIIDTHVSAADSQIEDNIAEPDMRSVQNTTGTNTSTNFNIIEKAKQLKDLQSQLKALQVDLQQLQTFRTRLNKNSAVDELSESDLELVLENIDSNEPLSTLPTDKNPLFQKHSSSYLTIFTPSTLSMSYQTWDKLVSGRQKFVYQTTLVASEPWPRDVFSVTLDTLIDWDTDAVEDVVLVKHTKQHELSKWIQSRLQDPILKYDAATIVTGAGQFLEASIKRARIWEMLIEFPVPSGGTEVRGNEQNNSECPVTSQKEAGSLLPYIFKTQHVFATSGTQQRTRHSLGSAKKLMLTYDISLDWLGQAEVKTEILLTGFSQETTETAKRLYVELQGLQGVVEALNGVKGILGMNGDGDENSVDRDLGKMRAKKGKARRVTDFN